MGRLATCDPKKEPRSGLHSLVQMFVTWTRSQSNRLSPLPMRDVDTAMARPVRCGWLASTCEDRRVCTDCLVEQALDEFHRSDRGRRMTVCRACRLRKQKAYRAGLSADRRARNRLGMVAWRFGLTSEAVAQILIQQRNRCAICNRLMKRGRGVEGANLDHKRGTRLPRGFLCKECNIKVGHFEHVQRFSAEFMAKMTTYLHRYENDLIP